ncbi:MAG: hypothetical protein IKU55_04945 [Clostridia bacterium]|nr:hypothetical protein [Clostridia bacterium]
MEELMKAAEFNEEAPVPAVTEPAASPVANTDVADLHARIGEQLVKNLRMERALAKANRQLQEYRRAAELQELRQHDPKASLTELESLGPEYAKLRRAGVSAIAAYEALRYQRAIGEIPPNTGAIGTDRAAEKEFYSPEEVDRLTSRELDDPKIMECVMKSMTKWKK